MRSCVSSVSRRKARRMERKPTGASFATPSVPRKSRSPSASTSAEPRRNSSAVATAFQRHAGTGHQRLQQHVAGAQFQARAAGRRMQSGDGERPARFHFAGNRLIVDRSFRPQRDQRAGSVVAIDVFQRRLHRFQASGIHVCGSPFGRFIVLPPDDRRQRGGIAHFFESGPAVLATGLTGAVGYSRERMEAAVADDMNAGAGRALGIVLVSASAAVFAHSGHDWRTARQALAH